MMARFLWIQNKSNHHRTTPTSTLHRVFHRAVMTMICLTILNNSTHHHHLLILNHLTNLCQIIHIHHLQAFHLMMIRFTHRFNHHLMMVTHLVMMMMRCTHHKNHQIIRTIRFPEPTPFQYHQIHR